MAKFDYEDTGMIGYGQCWDYQKQLLGQIQTAKAATGAPVAANRFLLVEHPHVYTVGKSGNRQNLLIDDAFREKIGAAYVKIDRGGDITYHGPGQLVGYPIIDLEYYRIGIREYVEKMETALIETVMHYGIAAGRKNGAVGVWIDADDPRKARKICAIGVRVSRFVTMHGFALNVNTDLRYFSYINPCGLTFGVTSIEKELGHPVGLHEVRELVKEKFNSVY